MGGRNVFMGYLNLPEKTEEAVDEEGWLHSGDLGKVDKRGIVTITGRSKVSGGAWRGGEEGGEQECLLGRRSMLAWVGYGVAVLRYSDKYDVVTILP